MMAFLDSVVEEALQLLGFGNRFEYLEAQFYAKVKSSQPIFFHLDLKGFVAWFAVVCTDEDDSAFCFEVYLIQFLGFLRFSSQQTGEYPNKIRAHVEPIRRQ